MKLNLFIIRSYLKKIRTYINVTIVAIIQLLIGSQIQAQNLPAGFSQVLVANGISNPTVAAIAPDGRVFIAEQGGNLRIVKNGILLSNSFVSINVNSDGERGLIGLAFDPDFVNNQYIYTYYTKPDASNNRVSRFTANGDLAEVGSEQIILELDPLSGATNHNGGTMAFGGDGKLYIGVGENANTANSQNLDTYHGKILRINSDGSIPSGNPYTSGNEQKKRVWSFGLRNPYTLAVQPETGKVFVNDVGQNTWEEINDATASNKNFGWPTAEGFSSNPLYTNPVYNYAHGSGDGNGCAITGGTFFNPTTTNYPSTYIGKYFFIDFCNSWINTLDLTANPVTRSSFGTSIAGGAVSIITGTDGNLYFLSRNNGGLYKIVYTDNSAPTITQQPTSISVSGGQPATFSVVASGGQPLTYQWRKNGVNIPNASASSYTINSVNQQDAGNYRCRVSNPNGNSTSNIATLTVTGNNGFPTAQIITPAQGTNYGGGQVINFSGAATDAEDGSVPATKLTWSIVFHHDDHTHDSPPIAIGVSSGSYTIPNSGETATNVFYRLILVAEDSQGAKDSAFVDILPRLSTLTVTSNPAGAAVTVDGQPFTSPVVVESVEGVLRSIGTTTTQTINNALKINFNNWSNGGTQTQTFATPANNTTYTANFIAQLKNAENVTNTAQGLDYKYYEGNWNVLPNFGSLTPVETGTLANFSLTEANRADNFGFVYTGYVEVPVDGIYTFFTKSDEGSKLFVGNKLVVNNDGLHAVQEKQGQIGLKSGKHTIKVTYFEKINSQQLQVGYAGPGFTKQLIANANLSRSILGLSQTSDFSDASAFNTENEKSIGEIKIFPNPSTSGFELRASDFEENAKLSIYSMNGELVYNKIVNSSCYFVSTTDWAKGIYFLKFETGQNVIFKKLEVID